MKYGFSLIEIIVALALASLLTIALYTSFEQTRRIAKKIESITDKSSHLMLLYAQFERDFTAATVPSSLLVVDQKETSTQAAGTQLIDKSENQEKELTPEMIKKIFNVTMQGREKEVSFVTTSALLGYKEIKPRLVRVIYRLIPLVGKENSFILTRQEFQVASKNGKEKEKAPAIEMIEGIKKLDISFVIQKRDEASEELLVWDAAENEEIKQLLPNYITFKGVIESPRSQQEYSFTFTYELPAASLTRKPEKKGKNTASTTQKTSQAFPPPSQGKTKT